MIEFEGMNVLVVGLGVSGFAAAGVARARGASVTVVDSSDRPSMAGRVHGLEAGGTVVRLGTAVPDDLLSFDLVVASPGVPDRTKVLEMARKGCIKVISELEMGYSMLPNELIAVTGTNGKTTTTALLGEILDRPGRRAVTCGNIGNPLVAQVGQAGDGDLLVVEVSSFQLANIEDFRPGVAVILNVAPDHFDWHAGFDDYVAAKSRITENQGPGDFLVYNSDDVICERIAAGSAAATVGFGLDRSPGSGVWLECGWIMAGEPLRATEVMPVDEIDLAGIHNVLNVMAACGAALAVGEGASSIREAVGRFEGLEHRMEPVLDVAGVRFFNDSKATNPHATVHAVRSFEEPTVLIMGGRNKGLDFGGLAAEVCKGLVEGALIGVVLIGECADELRTAIGEACPGTNGSRIAVETEMDSAVHAAYRFAAVERTGAAVLFSPASASFDMFDDYKHRGVVFKQSVARLAREVGG